MRPLLLINGYAATGSDWDPGLLAGLEAGFDLLHPDNRGTGSAPLGAEELTIAGLAADMLGSLDRRGVSKAVVAGWSMGGFVAQEIAAQAPERVEALVLLATDPGGPEAVRGEPQALARLFDHGGTPREQARELLSLLFPPPLDAQVDAEAGELVAAGRAALSPATLTAEEAAMNAWYEREGPARRVGIGAPTLILAGERDVVIPAANAELLAAAIPGAELKTFAEAGHGFIAQEAAPVCAAIRDFAAAP
jgi:pimeloyl-ACP methyl ester carboxylesterase